MTIRKQELLLTKFYVYNEVSWLSEQSLNQSENSWYSVLQDKLVVFIFNFSQFESVSLLLIKKKFKV